MCFELELFRGKTKISDESVFTVDTAGWPDPVCRFPDWLRGVTWHSFDDQWKFSFKGADYKVLTVHEMVVAAPSSSSNGRHGNGNLENRSTTVERSEFRCQHLTTAAADENEVFVYSMALHNWYSASC